jgi:alpha-ribazole phosphatase/probable phosphoglycerate mutase
MLHLYLVRHGETEWNAQHRYQGHSDLPLNQKGIEQARQLAIRLQSQKIDLVYSSDLQRAQQTAEILTTEINLRATAGREIKVQSDPRLREINFGMLEGYTFDEALERWPEMIARWLNDYNQPPEGGERIDEFAARVSQFLSEIRKNCAEKTVLVVAHGGPLREIIQSVLGTSQRTQEPSLWFNLEHASLTEFQIDDENIIINRLNDVGHFDL